jgi:hypothetical protein
MIGKASILEGASVTAAFFPARDREPGRREFFMKEESTLPDAKFSARTEEGFSTAAALAKYIG